MQVRFELVYGSETSCLTVHLHEKARIDASTDMMLNTQKENSESDGRTWKRCTFRQEEEDDYQNNTYCAWKTLEKGYKTMV